jgi:hypothetical protein
VVDDDAFIQGTSALIDLQVVTPATTSGTIVAMSLFCSGCP